MVDVSALSRLELLSARRVHHPAQIRGRLRSEPAFVLLAAKQRAVANGTSVGHAPSAIAREGLRRAESNPDGDGVPLIANATKTVSQRWSRNCWTSHREGDVAGTVARSRGTPASHIETGQCPVSALHYLSAVSRQQQVGGAQPHGAV